MSPRGTAPTTPLRAPATSTRVGQPVTVSRTPSKMAAQPPEFGEQTDEVLREFRFSAEEIVALKQSKVV